MPIGDTIDVWNDLWMTTAQLVIGHGLPVPPEDPVVVDYEVVPIPRVGELWRFPDGGLGLVVKVNAASVWFRRARPYGLGRRFPIRHRSVESQGPWRRVPQPEVTVHHAKR